MTKLILILGVFLSLSAFADSNTGSAPSAAPSPIPMPSPAPTPEEHISETRYVVSGIVGSYFGVGIGHAIQGRYSSRGWIFTAGELGSVMIMLEGILNCAYHNWQSNNSNEGCDNALIAVGAIGFIGFKVWEIVDLWSVPVTHNLITDTTKPKPELRLGFLPPVQDRPTIFALNYRF